MAHHSRTSLCTETHAFGDDWPVQSIPLSMRLTPDVTSWTENEMAALAKLAVPLFLKDYAGYLNLSLSRWRIPSPVVRLDMAPDCRGVYELESNPAGLGVAHHFGLPITRAVADSLRALDVTRIAWGVAPSRESQREDLRILMDALAQEEGFSIREITDLTTEKPGNDPLWLRAGQEDITLISPLLPQCLLLHQHGGGHKGYLERKVGGRFSAVQLSHYAHPEYLDTYQIFTDFPDGFVLKPKEGWGTRNTHFWTSNSLFRKESLSRVQIERALNVAYRSGEPFIVQAFAAPDRFAGNNWIWRVYATYSAEEKRYRLAGGFVAGRSSLRVHGSDDCLSGLIYI